MIDASTVVDDHESAAAPLKRSLVGPIVVLMAVTIVIGVLVTFGVGGPVDRSLLKSLALRQHVASEGLVGTVQWISWFGEAGQRSLVMALFALWLVWRGRRWSALVMLIAPPLAGVGSSILKEVFARERPDVVPHLDVVTNLAYPSGHATNAMALYLLAALLMTERRRWLWVSLGVATALLIGTTRVLLGVHWPSDVLGGWCWGAGFAMLGYQIARTKEAGQKAKRAPIRMSRPPSGA